MQPDPDFSEKTYVYPELLQRHFGVHRYVLEDDSSSSGLEGYAVLVGSESSSITVTE